MKSDSGTYIINYSLLSLQTNVRFVMVHSFMNFTSASLCSPVSYMENKCVYTNTVYPMNTFISKLTTKCARTQIHRILYFLPRQRKLLDLGYKIFMQNTFDNQGNTLLYRN